jgi:hypothetical protein
MSNKKILKGLCKYVRLQKAWVRREFVFPGRRQEKIRDIYRRLGLMK